MSDLEDELMDELEDGRIAAEQLARHLVSMGAQKASIPVQIEDGCFVIEIRRTL